MTNTAYTAHVRVGVHEWDIVYDPDDPDPVPEYGPASGLRFSWQARQDDGWPTQHEPTVLAFAIVVAAGEDLDDVDQGTSVHFTFTPDGYASPLLEFGGTVRDLVARPRGVGMVYEITAVDHLQKLAEDYTISAFFPSGESLDLYWPRLVQSAALNGGTGITPALPDPLAGDVKLAAGLGAFWGGDHSIIDESAWDVFTGLAASQTLKAGGTPFYQRVVFSYQLDPVTGELDAAHPFEGTWLAQGNGNAPQDLELGVDGWTVGGGNVDGCLMVTDGTEWSRPRIEPNVVIYEEQTWVRAHTGPDIVRVMTADDLTDGIWVTSGVETDDQWSSELELLASEDPATVAGWFTLPSAMRIAVAAYDIDARHTPTGKTTTVGMLGGASLTINPGGSWRVGFHLRRTLPDPSASGTGGWAAAPDALTFADLAADHPTLTYAEIDPALTYRDLTFL